MSGRVGQFLLFCGDTYYPSGGIDDMVGSFGTLDDAQKAGEAEGGEWQQIFDLETGLSMERWRASHVATWRERSKPS